MAEILYIIPKVLGLGLDNWFWTLGTLVIGLLAIVFVIIVKGGKPLANVLKHQFLNWPLLLVVRKDKAAELKAMPYDTGCFLDKTKEFIAVPEAAYRLVGGGMVAIADERYGVTLPFDLVIFAMEAKKKKVSPTTFINAINAMREGDEDGGKVTAPDGTEIKTEATLTETLKKIKAELLVKHLYEIGDEVDKQTGKTKRYIKPLKILKTIDVQAIANFFLYNINPFALTARVEKRVTQKYQEITNKDWGKVVVLVSMMLIVAAIAVVILRTGGVQTAGSAIAGSAGAIGAATSIR